MGSGSTSKSSSTSTNENYDNRVVNEDDGVVINSGSSLTITDEFPEEVQTLVYDILGFAGDVGQSALDITNQSINSVNMANDSLGARLTEIEQGGTKQYIGIAAFALVVIVAIMIIRKK